MIVSPQWYGISENGLSSNLLLLVLVDIGYSISQDTIVHPSY